MIGTSFSHYRVTAKLAEGGMGEVYVGFDETLARKVALKAIRSDRRPAPEARARFLREARVLSQLDHPRICRVYDYVAGDDADFIVLELVEGRSLREVLAAGLDRSRALRVAEQLVEVLVVAHAAGVVHRDLKPDNVMLDRAGEVKVLDFGLARIAGAPRLEAPPASVPLARNEAVGAHGPEEDETLDALPPSPGAGQTDALTAVGAITGTPAYMSPEQARGEAATTASDVYSLGILLQELFTGQRAYPPDLHGLGLVRHVSGAGPLPVAGVDPELAGLIRQMESLAPSQRPTAVEAAGRLRGIRERPRRRARRATAAAALVVVALAGFKYTVDLRRERSLAVAAREEGDRRREQAEGLISFMLGDLRTKLEPLGRLDILDEVGDKARVYFAAVPEAQLTDSELFRRSQALRQIGEVRVAQGRLDEALEVFHESLRLAEDLARRDPARGEWQVGLGASHFWVGYIAFYQGRTQDAEAPFLRYLEIARGLVARDPANREYRTELAYAQSNVGSLREKQGDLEGALLAFDEVLSVRQSLLAEAPEDAAQLLDVAHSHNTVAVIHEKLGEMDEALEHFRADVDIEQRLAARDPANNRQLASLAVSYAFLAAVREARGEDGEAAALLDEALRIRRRLAAHDPSNADWARELAVACLRAGQASFARGDLAAAEAGVREGRDALSRMLAQDPSNVDWRRMHASSLRAAANIALASSRAPDARRDAQAAADTLRQLLDLDPADATVRVDLAKSLLVLGRVHAALGDPSGAAVVWNRALDAVAALKTPTAEALGERARALLHLGRGDEARSIVESLVKKGYRRRELLELCREKGLQIS